MLIFCYVKKKRTNLIFSHFYKVKMSAKLGFPTEIFVFPSFSLRENLVFEHFDKVKMYAKT